MLNSNADSENEFRSIDLKSPRILPSDKSKKKFVPYRAPGSGGASAFSDSELSAGWGGNESDSVFYDAR